MTQDDHRLYRFYSPDQDGPTIHDPRKCQFCANDPEQCHVSIDCEYRAWGNGFCGPHQPDPRSYH